MNKTKATFVFSKGHISPTGLKIGYRVTLNGDVSSAPAPPLWKKYFLLSLLLTGWSCWSFRVQMHQIPRTAITQNLQPRYSSSLGVWHKSLLWFWVRPFLGIVMNVWVYPCQYRTVHLPLIVHFQYERSQSTCASPCSRGVTEKVVLTYTSGDNHTGNYWLLVGTH